MRFLVVYIVVYVSCGSFKGVFRAPLKLGG